jgi:hypothetical protein
MRARAQGIGHLDADMSALRALQSSSAALVAALKDVAAPAPGAALEPKQDAAAAASARTDWSQSTEALRCAASAPRSLEKNLNLDNHARGRRKML